MIKIQNFPPTFDDWISWVDECERRTRTELLPQGKIDPYSVKVDGLYKRDDIRKKYYFSTEGPFFGRCAFCQIDLAAQFPDIEHFRPKKGVTDENDTPEMVEYSEGVKSSHAGYYWLAYDWRNLLPSCQKCNRPSSPNSAGKRNRFPIAGKRAILPGDSLLEESPLLLHPVFDDPEEHFTVDLDSDGAEGILIPVTPRGRMTEKVFCLNIRADLVEARVHAVTRLQFLFTQLISNPVREAAKASIRAMLIDCGPGTLAARCAFTRLKQDISVI